MVPIDGLLKERCGKDAQGRHISKATHDGQMLSHFECDAGHMFHTDETCRYYFECDCRPRYAQANRSMSPLMQESKTSSSE